VLALADLELIETLDLSFVQVQSLIRLVSKGCIQSQPKSVSQHNANRNLSYLKTHILILDAYLRGGIPSGSITEIVGPHQGDKSHFSYMLAVMATLPKVNQG